MLKNKMLDWKHWLHMGLYLHQACPQNISGLQMLRVAFKIRNEHDQGIYDLDWPPLYYAKRKMYVP